jgi:hypothetical protein
VDIFSLFEARRNPEINTGMRSKQVSANFEPFFGNHDAFVSMIDVPKIGINPKTGHHTTPAGIYAYQLGAHEIVNQFSRNSLPYMGDAKYAALIMAKPGIKWFSSSDTASDFAEQRSRLDTIIEKLIGKADWAVSKRRAWRDVPATWAGAHEAAEFYNEIHLAASIMSLLQEEDKDGLTAEDYVNSMSGEGHRRPFFWNSLLRKLGYDAVIDHGTKMIYNLEPFQTCFLHTGAIENYEIFRNGRSGVYHHGKEIESVAHFMRIIQQRQMSAEQAMAFISAMVDKRDVVLGVSDHNYYAYNPSIRLSHAQIREMIEFLFREDPVAVEHAMANHQIFDTELWKIAGDIVDLY